MKAQFTDSTKTAVFIDFNNHKMIVPYESILEVREDLSVLINERQQLDAATKAKADALAKANSMLAAQAKISKEVVKDAKEKDVKKPV
jgi:hypothetical protein